jgi:transposase
MAKKTELSNQVIEAALEMAQQAKTPDELRMAQTVLVPSFLQISDDLTGQIVGRSRGTVVRLRKQFRELCSGQEPPDRNWGGRRYGYMTVEQENQFLSEYFEQASHGGVLVVSEIKKAFEALVGQKVAKTTIYRMLDRHDWRKVMPRPRHPKSDPKAQKGFKKTSKDSV